MSAAVEAIAVMVAGVQTLPSAEAIASIDGGAGWVFWWTVMAVALLNGIGIAVTGVVLAVSDLAHRRLAPH